MIKFNLIIIIAAATIAFDFPAGDRVLPANPSPASFKRDSLNVYAFFAKGSASQASSKILQIFYEHVFPAFTAYCRRF